MPRMLVSEITHMKNGLFCVAGLLLDEGRMVRPLDPYSGRLHWPVEMLDRGGWMVGGLFEVQPVLSAPRTRGYPHATEDRFIDPSSIQIVQQLSDMEAVRRLASTVYPTVSDIFSRMNHGKKYVHDGSQCPSLGAVQLQNHQYRFVNTFERLECRINDTPNSSYFLKVSSRNLNRRYEVGGLQALEDLRKNHPRSHLRVGLANAWEGMKSEYDPRRCYAMLNGVFFLG